MKHFNVYISFLIGILIVAVGWWNFSPSDIAKNSPPQKRPNILFLFADDWGKYASAYAPYEQSHSINSLIETPNFDRIASNGALFTNAFVPAPSCTPCRSSILSGQYFYNTGRGAILHGAEWDKTIPTYPLLLEKYGYHIGFTYKVWSPGNLLDAPYGGKSKAYEKAGTRFNRFSQIVSEAKDKDIAKKQLYDEVRQNFKSFLNDNDDNAPFCYWFGPTNTHRPWAKGSGKELWGLDPDRLQGRLPSFLADTPEIREDFNDYLGEVLAWDEAVWVIMDVLKKEGELDNTIVVISGDHGVPGIPRAKTNLYDLGTRVAMAISWPGHIKKGKVIDQMVNLMDLAPTFLEVGGVEAPSVMNGRSLIPLVTGKMEESTRDFVITGRERHVAQAREGNLPYPQRAYRTNDYLYIRNLKPNRWPIGTLEDGLRDIDGGPTRDWYIVNYDSIKNMDLWNISFGKRPKEEFYNVRKDPDHIQNLAYNRAYKELKEIYSDKMDSVLIATKDPRMVIDPDYFDKMPFINENEFNIKQHEENKKRVNEIYNNSRFD
ncbi:sulfatase family protein [Confluentibacter lentus]|uniref:sulfatase family protein n=1 Tax=Confluentibacter lentus TaxID=1699412 RepID=UPI000C28E710|nr:sulfatase [Confluentibacter lentus]